MSDLAANPDSLRHALDFIRQLPHGMKPDDGLGVDPDGEVSFEWYGESPRNLLGVSMSPQGQMAYAWTVGAERGRGVISAKDFLKDDKMFALVRRVRQTAAFP